MENKEQSTEQENAVEQEREMTPEEITAMQQSMVSYYEDLMKVLKPQLEYEKMLAELEEARLRKLIAMVKSAQIMQGPKPQSTPEPQPTDPKEEKKPRKLKTE